MAKNVKKMRLTAVMSMAAKAAFPKDYRYGTNRPRTIAAKRLNPPGKKRRKVFIELIAYEDWSVFKGDTVEILSGKDKGKQGKLAQVFRHRNWVILDGLNTSGGHTGEDLHALPQDSGGGGYGEAGHRRAQEEPEDLLVLRGETLWCLGHTAMGWVGALHPWSPSPFLFPHWSPRGKN
ncbi:probable 39S ribosomal protein L24, mitochondrial [Coregonus clupeaformis]|uniref:probable 39S ribosomal protein L24, mitochondrial n=1 Tax=Coregonus clupeaformis TaxID=59861 RepID=UPI001E1C72C7|nr:probable 39S ribosomal protein L24, mitochondrial [Coregonus clupeaformis]